MILQLDLPKDTEYITVTIDTLRYEIPVKSDMLKHVTIITKGGSND